MKKRNENQGKEQNLFNHKYNKLISILSSHFSELIKEQIEKLLFEIIEEILNDEELKIEDEDSLLKSIISIYEKDNTYCKLFEYVKYENVSEEMLWKFFEVFNINDINSGIWKSICRYLAGTRKQEKLQKEEEKENIIEFNHEQGKEFEWILRYLSS